MLWQWRVGGGSCGGHCCIQGWQRGWCCGTGARIQELGTGAGDGSGHGSVEENKDSLKSKQTHKEAIDQEVSGGTLALGKCLMVVPSSVPRLMLEARYWVGAGSCAGSAERRKENLRSKQTYLEAQDPEVNNGSLLWPAHSMRRSTFLMNGSWF